MLRCKIEDISSNEINQNGEMDAISGQSVI